MERAEKLEAKILLVWRIEPDALLSAAELVAQLGLDCAALRNAGRLLLLASFQRRHSFRPPSFRLLPLLHQGLSFPVPGLLRFLQLLPPVLSTPNAVSTVGPHLSSITQSLFGAARGIPCTSACLVMLAHRYMSWLNHTELAEQHCCEQVRCNSSAERSTATHVSFVFRWDTMGSGGRGPGTSTCVQLYGRASARSLLSDFPPLPSSSPLPP